MRSSDLRINAKTERTGRTSFFFSLGILLLSIPVILFGGGFREALGSGKTLIAYAIIISFALGIMFLSVKKRTFLLGRSVIIFMIYFVTICLFAIFHAFINTYNTETLIAVGVMFALSGLGFFYGYALIATSKLKIPFLFIAFVAFISVAISNNDFSLMGVSFNKNWISLGPFLIMMARISLQKEILRMDYIAIGAWAAFCLVHSTSHGVFLAALVLLTLNFFFGRFLIISRPVSYLFLAVSISVPFLIGGIIESQIGQDIKIAIEAYSGERLGSGRIPYWVGVLEQTDGIENIFGHGLDATIANVSDGYFSNSATHNAFIEVFLRFGLIGVIFYSILLFSFFKTISRDKSSRKLMCIPVSILVLQGVYGLGSFSHWPGTIIFWLIYGILLGRTEIPFLVATRGQSVGGNYAPGDNEDILSTPNGASA